MTKISEIALKNRDHLSKEFKTQAWQQTFNEVGLSGVNFETKDMQDTILRLAIVQAIDSANRSL